MSKKIVYKTVDDKRVRRFCDIISPEKMKEIDAIIKKLPIIETFFGCQGQCYVYINGRLAHKIPPHKGFKLP